MKTVAAAAGSSLYLCQNHSTQTWKTPNGILGRERNLLFWYMTTVELKENNGSTSKCHPKPDSSKSLERACHGF